MKIVGLIKQRLNHFISKIKKSINDLHDYTKVNYIKYRDMIFDDKYRYYFASITFIPFIGWLIPLYLKKDDDFSQNQSKMGFYMALFFLVLDFFLLFLYIFAPKEWRLYRLVLVIFIYMTHLLYFGVCIYGIHLTMKMNRFGLFNNIAVFDKYRKLIEL